MGWIEVKEEDRESRSLPDRVLLLVVEYFDAPAEIIIANPYKWGIDTVTYYQEVPNFPWEEEE